MTASSELEAQGLYLSTSSESAARSAKVLPDGPSEDASDVLGDPPIGRGETFSGDPMTEVEWVVTLAWTELRRIDAAEVNRILDEPRELSARRPVVRGRDSRGWHHLSPELSGSYDRLALAWDYVPWNGEPLTTVDTRALRRAIDAAAPAEAEVSVSLPAGEVDARAAQLAKWSREWELDAQVVVEAPDGERYDGVGVWDALSCLGLVWGDGDFFHWVNRDYDRGPHAHFTVGTSTPPGYFLPERAVAGELRVHDLDFGFPVGRSVDPLAVFVAMMRGARYVAERLGGRICVADGDMSEVEMRGAIERQVASMEAAGIPPGSAAALYFMV